MAYWLLKTEPSEYSFDDLLKSGKAPWDGVANALALKHIRAMKKGDQALIYHTGDERAVVGIAQVVSDAYTPAGEKDPKIVVVDLKAKGKLKKAVALDTIKADPAFAGWDLLRIGRLSVVPTSEKMWNRVIDLGK
jgi:predicted RNA-binding protein with PUA-like domain